MAAVKGEEAQLSGGVSDTVGVIAVDHSNKVAATVSSGGNWLKFPGRVGHSPQFGAGCWAMNRGPMSDTSVAVSSTGVGEMLSKVQWAAQCGKMLQDNKFITPVEAISTAMKEHFLGKNKIVISRCIIFIRSFRIRTPSRSQGTKNRGHDWIDLGWKSR